MQIEILHQVCQFNVVSYNTGHGAMGHGMSPRLAHLH